MPLTLVTGATGTVGREVVRQLASRGVKARAFVRDRQKAEAVLGRDVEVAVGDLTRPETIELAMVGVERVFIVPPSDPRQA